MQRFPNYASSRPRFWWAVRFLACVSWSGSGVTVEKAADEGDAVNRLEATAYHTFPRCAKNAQKEEVLVHVKDLKVGDCLQTLHSDKLVTSVEKVKTHKNELTYSVITEGGKKDMIVVGGLAVSHATDAIEHTKIMKRLNADAKH